MAEKVVIIADNDKNKKTVYDCKGKTGICIPTTYSDFQANAFKGARAVGSTLYVKIYMCVRVVNDSEQWETVELTFKNYTSIKNVYFLTASKKNPTFPADYTTNPSYYNYIINSLDDIVAPDKEGGKVVTGTAFADTIDMHEYEVGTDKKGITINGLAGDDNITGTTGNDTITGGLGTNTLNYTKGDGNDVINLTNKENFVLNMSDGESESTYALANLKFELANKNKDLRIYTDSESTGDNAEFITLKNFAAKDVTGETGSVKLIIGGHTYDLKTAQDITDAEDIKDITLITKVINGTGSNYTGTNVSEVIDASAVEGRTVKKRTEDGEIEDVDESSNKGLSLNGGGGNDKITGSKYSDTLTGGKGNNTIYYSDGKDIVVLTKGEGLTLNLAEKEVVNYKKSGNNLLLEIDDENSIALKNYYKTDVVGKNGYVKVIDTSGTKNLAQDQLFELDESNLKGNKGKRTATLKGATRFGEEITIDVESVDLEEIGITFTEIEEDKEKTFEANVLKYNINAGNGNNHITFSGGINSNTISAGSGDDVIEISNTYGYEYDSESGESVGFKNALTTVKAGAGRNEITVSGEAGNNLLITGKDNDTFNIAGVSTTKIKAGGGKNTINIQASDIGTVTLMEEKVKGAQNDIVFAGGVDVTSVTKNKNDLIFNTAADSSLIVKNYFSQTGKNATKTINGKTYDKFGEFLNANNLTIGITGSGTIKGTEFEDSILTDDSDAEYLGNAKNDKIYGGKGNDIIKAGLGDNSIFYSAGDGNDTVYYGGGEDTLVFDKGMKVTAAISGEDVVITYSANGSAENYVRLKGYGVESNKVSHLKVKIGSGKAQDISISGTAPIFISKDDNEKTFNLANGNNTIVFSDEPNLGRDNILASVEGREGGTDTIKFDKLSLMDNTVAIYAEQESSTYTDNLWVDADIPVNMETGGGSFSYKDFYAGSTASVIIQDKDRAYNVTAHVNHEDISLSGTGNSVTIIKDTVTDTANTLNSNTAYNHITAFGGAALNYNYAGGYDNVVTLDFETDDSYNVNNFTKNTSLNIDDWGGNDTLNVTLGSDTTADDLRLVFDVYKEDEEDEEYTYSNKHVILVHRDNLTADILKASASPNATLLNGINIVGCQGNTEDVVGIETIVINDTPVTTVTWTASIFTKVSEWLGDHECLSVAAALEKYKNDAITLSGLFACYKYEQPSNNGIINVNGTVYYEPFDDAANPLVLSSGQNNTVTFNKYEEYYCYITSNNTSEYVDTLKFPDFTYGDDMPWLYVEYIPDSENSDSGKYNLSLNASNQYQEEITGDNIFEEIYVTYNDFKPNNEVGDGSKVVVVDKEDDNYDVHLYTTSVIRDHSGDANGQIEYIFADNSTISITANDKHNFTRVESSEDEKCSNLTYTYNGGTDKVYTKNTSNDTYIINSLNASTSFNVIESGGDDTVDIATTFLSDVRLVFDVIKGEGESYDYDVARMAIISDGALTETNFVNIFDGEMGTFINDNHIGDNLGIEHIKTSDYRSGDYTNGITASTWYSAVAASVASWLNDTDYNKVSDALDAYNTAIDDKPFNLQTLVDAYDVSYTPQAS